jgi:hypothetical protein
MDQMLGGHLYDNLKKANYDITKLPEDDAWDFYNGLRDVLKYDFFGDERQSEEFKMYSTIAKKLGDALDPKGDI